MQSNNALKIMKLSGVAIAMFLAGCGDSGSEFLGKWQYIQNERNTLEIVRNGDGFIIHTTSPHPWSGKPTTTSVPATLKSGMLEVQAGLGPVLLAVDKKSGHLVGGGSELKRVE